MNHFRLLNQKSDGGSGINAFCSKFEINDNLLNERSFDIELKSVDLENTQRLKRSKTTAFINTLSVNIE